MRQRILLLFSFLAMGIQSYAQEGIPVYFDYLADNYYLVYPSMAGIAEGGKIRLTARKQWFSVVVSPNVETFMVYFRLGEILSVSAD